MFTTEWPIWDVMAQLACYNTKFPCATRSGWNCFDVGTFSHVECEDYFAEPEVKQTFVLCGEHVECNVDPAFVNIDEFCVPHDHVPGPNVRPIPFVRNITHDWEERLCSQCGQDGVLQRIFSTIGLTGYEKK